MSYLRNQLRSYFGFQDFRPGQAQAVQSAMEGRDTIVVMPTGSGKSLCFQLPALSLPGHTVIVSPLIALMKDQADALQQRGFAVAVVNSTLSTTDEGQVLRGISEGRYEFIYATPERIAKPEFRALLKKHPIDLFVVDEAHCVSQWGHDFRPDYLLLGKAIDDLGRPPVLAFTASATSDVVDDIRRELKVPDAVQIHTGFSRPNLRLEVETFEDDGGKRDRLAELLKDQDSSGIVYAATVKTVEELAADLSSRGLPVSAYHGRMSARKRAAVQEEFMSASRTLVATNAFGLGIDKPDIRFVIHYNLPGSIESFYQEFGRAGRDGADARCVLLYDAGDQKIQRFFARGSHPRTDDLVNAYHTLSLVVEQHGRAASLREIQAVSPLSPSKMKSCLAFFINRSIVAQEKRGRYTLLRCGLTRNDLERAGRSYEERIEKELVRLEVMREYAAKSSCRWKRILSYFESDELGADRCQNCDICGRTGEALLAG